MFRSTKARTSRMAKSFYPRAIRLLNSSPKGWAALDSFKVTIERHSQEINRSQEILDHCDQRLQQQDQTLVNLTSWASPVALALAPANTTNSPSTAQSDPGQSVEFGSKQGNPSDKPAVPDAASPSEPGSPEAASPNVHRRQLTCSVSLSLDQ